MELHGGQDHALIKVLVRALRQLGEAGHPDQASRLAAEAWSAIRQSDPAAAERLNGTMHFLARLPDDVDTPHSGRMVRTANRKGE